MQAVARAESSPVTSFIRARRRSRSEIRTTSRARIRRSSRWKPSTSSGARCRAARVDEPPQGGLLAGPLEERRARRAPEEARVAGEQRRDHPGGAGEESERLQQVGLGGRGAGGIDVPLDPGEGEVRVRGAPGRGDHGVDPAGVTLREPREPLRRGGRRIGGLEAGDDVRGGHGSAANLTAARVAAAGDQASSPSSPGSAGAPRPARERPCCLIFLCRFVRSTPRAWAAWVMFQSCSSSFCTM